MRKLLFIFVLVSLAVLNLFAQETDSILINLTGSELKVCNSENEVLYEKKFSHPEKLYSDLDGDGINEFLIIDSTTIGKDPFFTVYVYNSADTFYLVDSVQSGLLNPSVEYSEEEKSRIIITGNTDFDRFNTDMQNIFLPINCWRFQDDNVFLVNDDIYDLFISENNSIMDYLDSYYATNAKNCDSSTKLKAAIAAAYANYLSAGDKTAANKFIESYYKCNDLSQFQKQLNEIMKSYINEN